MPLSTLARDLLAAGLNGGAPNGRDGAVVNEVQCVFHGLPMEAGLRREVALALARTVEAGASAGIAAGRELLDMVGVVVRLYEPEDWDEDEGWGQGPARHIRGGFAGAGWRQVAPARGRFAGGCEPWLTCT